MTSFRSCDKMIIKNFRIIALSVGSTLVNFVTPFLLSLATNNELWRCPPSIRQSPMVFIFNNLCIQFVIGDPEYWDVARDKCHSHGGHLVSVADYRTQVYLMAVLTHHHYTGEALWIRLSDGDTEGEWRWDTGYRLHGFTYWDVDQPAAILSTIEDCVVLQYTEGGHWHDKVCHLWPEYYDYICQYDLIPTTPTTASSTTPTTKTTTNVPLTTEDETSTTSTFTANNSTLPTTTSTLPTTTSTLPTTTSTLPTSTLTLPTTTTTVRCQEINCQKSCPNGYSGVYVGNDGCVNCKCN